MESLRTITSFEAFGARIAIRESGPGAQDLSIRLPPGAREVDGGTFDFEYIVRGTTEATRGEAARARLTRNGEDAGTFDEISDLELEIESDLHFRVALAAEGYLFVHAGVVAVDDEVVVLPGRTLSGKSSLVLALVEAGAGYYSDEFAIIDPSGLVHAYRKPLSERVAGQPLPRLHEPESLGAYGDAEPLPIGLTVVTRYDDMGVWQPTPVSKADALMALFDNTVLARERPEFALELISKAVKTTRGIRTTRKDAAEAAEGILDIQRPPRG